MSELPVIIQDSREQKPLVFDNLHIRGVNKLEIIVHKLDEGDYSIVGLENKVFIERKSAPDMYGTLFGYYILADGTKRQNRERFEEELDRVVEKDYKYRYLMIESTAFGFAQYMEYHKNLAQFNSAFSTLMSYAQRYNLKIRWCKTREGSVDYIARLSIKITEEENACNS